VANIVFELNVINWRSISAVLTFVGLMFAIFRPIVREQRKLKFRYVIGKPTPNERFVDLHICATNVRPKSVAVTTVGTEFKGGFPVKHAYVEERVLHENDNFTALVSLPLEQAAAIKKIYAIDVLGKRFFAPHNQIIKARTAAKKFMEE
jgi:hypothetical protein